MQLTAFNVLVGVAGIMALISMIKPQWPLLAIGVFLVCVALLFVKV